MMFATLFQLQLEFLLYISFTLFIISFLGIIFRGYKIINFLMCIEMMWLSVGLLFICISLLYTVVHGFVFTIMILTIAAAETAIGLALLVNFYKTYKSLDLKFITSLRG